MTLVLSDEDVARVLPMADCIEAMETAYRDHALSGAVNIPRIRYVSPTTTPGTVYGSNIHIGTTPSYDTAAIRIGGSARSTEPNAQGERSPKFENRNWGFIVLIDMQTGRPLAFIQEFYLSGIRVGATSGVAAKYLAPPDAQTVGMFGSGKLARTDLEALVRVRPVRSVKVYSPTKEHREEFAREMAQQLEIEVTPVDGPREAMEGTEIVCCATNAGYVSGKPVFDGDWLEPGQFVISAAEQRRQLQEVRGGRHDVRPQRLHLHQRPRQRLLEQPDRAARPHRAGTDVVGQDMHAGRGRCRNERNGSAARRHRLLQEQHRHGGTDVGGGRRSSTARRSRPASDRRSPPMVRQRPLILVRQGHLSLGVGGGAYDQSVRRLSTRGYRVSRRPQPPVEFAGSGNPVAEVLLAVTVLVEVLVE